MNTNKYFQIMDETGKATYEKIEKCLDGSIKEEELKGFIRTFIDGRLKNKRRLRSLLVRGVYEAVRDENWQEGLDVCVGFELWCLADYLTNDVFDNKLDKCSTKIERDSNLFYMSSAVIREIVEDTLRKATRKLSPKRENDVSNLFSNLVKDAYMHQWVDYTSKHESKNPKELEARINELFKKRYLDYEAGNCFGKICRISAITFGADVNHEMALKDYGENFSTSLQIVNDIADIADSGYDLKNGLITYPLALTSIKTEENIYNLPIEKIKKLFVKSGTFEETRKKAIEYKKKAKQSIKELPNRNILSAALVLAQTNKYYDYLRGLKND